MNWREVNYDSKFILTMFYSKQLACFFYEERTFTIHIFIKYSTYIWIIPAPMQIGCTVIHAHTPINIATERKQWIHICESQNKRCNCKHIFSHHQREVVNAVKEWYVPPALPVLVLYISNDCMGRAATPITIFLKSVSILKLKMFCIRINFSGKNIYVCK